MCCCIPSCKPKEKFENDAAIEDGDDDDDNEDEPLIIAAPTHGAVYMFVEEKLSKFLLSTLVRPLVVCLT